MLILAWFDVLSSIFQIISIEIYYWSKKKTHHAECGLLLHWPWSYLILSAYLPILILYCYCILFLMDPDGNKSKDFSGYPLILAPILYRIRIAIIEINSFIHPYLPSGITQKLFVLIDLHLNRNRASKLEKQFLCSTGPIRHTTYVLEPPQNVHQCTCRAGFTKCGAPVTRASVGPPGYWDMP